MSTTHSTSTFLLAAFPTLLAAVVGVLLSIHSAYGSMQDTTVVYGVKLEQQASQINELQNAIKIMQPAVVITTATTQRMEKDIDTIIEILREQ